MLWMAMESGRHSGQLIEWREIYEESLISQSRELC